MFIHDDRDPLPVELSPFIGSLTCEISDAFGQEARCIAFVGLGAKSYCMKIQVPGEDKGVNLTNARSDSV